MAAAVVVVVVVVAQVVMVVLVMSWWSAAAAAPAAAHTGWPVHTRTSSDIRTPTPGSAAAHVWLQHAHLQLSHGFFAALLRGLSMTRPITQRVSSLCDKPTAAV
jgi:hypothetical protein